MCVYVAILLAREGRCFGSLIALGNIQIIHSSEGISKNYPHKVTSEQSNTHEAIAKPVFGLFLKVPSVGSFTNARTK